MVQINGWVNRIKRYEGLTVFKHSYRPWLGLLLVGTAILITLLMFLIVAMVVVAFTRGEVKAPDDMKFKPVSTVTSRPSPTMALPGASYAPEINIIELPTPAPTPTLVHLDATVDFTPDMPLVGWPVGGQISQRFGCTPYYTEIPGIKCPYDAPWFHDGIDIAGPQGAPVRAAITGTVTFAAPDGSGPRCNEYQGYGLSVLVDNGQGWETLYAHLSRLDVRVGQEVGPDTLIGAIGQTGCATGPHLHFGLRYQGTLVDAGLYMPDEEQ